MKLLLENGADIYHEEGGEFPAQIASQMRPKKYDPERKNGTVFEDGYDEETHHQFVTDGIVDNFLDHDCKK